MTEALRAPRRPNGHGSDRGRPRDPAVDAIILEATLGLLAEVGYDGLSVAEIARRGEVTKPLIYRRWAKKSQLVVEAMMTRMPHEPTPDSGDTARDLVEFGNRLAATFSSSPAGRALPGLVAAMATDAEFASSYRALIIEPTRSLWRCAVERGIARGDLIAETDVEFVLDVLVGPLYVRLLITGDPVDLAYPRLGVELVFARYGAAPPRGNTITTESRASKSITTESRASKSRTTESPQFESR